MAPGEHPVIYLHIGAMKTGTTFLQQLMIANKKNLLQAGYLFPGERWNEQDRAVRDILDMAREDPPMHALCAGMWDKITAQMLAFEGRAAIFSMEFLSFANAKQAARVVDSLSPAEVHVILTVRDAVGAIPAQWQTHTRNGGTASWPRFVRGARWGARLGRLSLGQGAEVFLRAQGIPRMLGAWARALPPGHLHVVTVPRSGSDPMLLWQRFASVVGVDPAVCSNETDKSNPSLGQPSAEVMRRINAKIGKLPPSKYQPTLKAQLATNVLTKRSSIEQGASPDRKTQDFALHWNRKVREAIQRSGADLVGDLADLPIEAEPNRSPPASVLSSADPQDVLAAAATARDGLVTLVRRRSRRLRKLDAPADVSGQPVPDGTDLPTSADRWSSAADPVDAAVSELTALTRQAIELQQRLEVGRRDSR